MYGSSPSWAHWIIPFLTFAGEECDLTAALASHRPRSGDRCRSPAPLKAAWFAVASSSLSPTRLSQRGPTSQRESPRLSRASVAYLIWPRISPLGDAVVCTFA
jgi:hypothetical protein